MAHFLAELSTVGQANPCYAFDSGTLEDAT